MASTALQIQPVVRQHLETIRLLGVDFVPFGNPVVDLQPEMAAPQAGLAVQATKRGDVQAQASALEELQRRHDATCSHCTGVTYHSRTVFGEGNPAADLMFIGEAPGEEEDRTGRPFVGRAGQKLDDIIKAMGFTRSQVYIANVLKSRPPANRTPLQHEVEGCSPFLAEQIRIIRPKVIVALGGPAAKLLLRTETGITRIRGQWGWYQDGALRIRVMPTFHPSYILRNYTLDTRQKVWADMQAVLDHLTAEK